MRNRLTKQAMGKDDSPTTMHVDHANPDVSKYETGDPSAWAEDVNMDKPWELENSKGREDTGHAKKVRDSSQHTYASAVKEAQELESKALRCLKMSEVMLGEDAPADVIERQAVDFMTMSNKSVLATLRRMREFEENISETRVAKIVDAVLEVIAEDDAKEEKEEAKEEKKASSDDEDSMIASVVEATLEVISQEEKEAKEECKEEEMKEDKEAKKAEKEEMKEEKKEEDKEAKKASSEDELVLKITAAVLSALGKNAEKEEVKEEKKEEEKEAKKAEKEEEKKEEEKEAKKAEKEEEKEEAKEEKKEEAKEASQEISFEDGYDVTASDEDSSLLSQLFTTKEADEEGTEKEAKIKTLKNVTASNSAGSEIDKLSNLWNKDF